MSRERGATMKEKGGRMTMCNMEEIDNRLRAYAKVEDIINGLVETANSPAQQAKYISDLSSLIHTWKQALIIKRLAGGD